MHFAWYQGKVCDSYDTHQTVALRTKKGVLIFDSPLEEIGLKDQAHPHYFQGETFRECRR